MTCMFKLLRALFLGEFVTTLLVKVLTQYDGKGIGKADKDVDALNKSIGKLTKVATGALVGAGVAATKFGVDSIKAFTSFDKQMREVFTLLPGISNQAMEQMKADVLDFSREAGRLPEEVIPAVYQSISAGVPQENVFDFLKVASQAAEGGATNLITAVDGITSAMNAYGPATLSAAQASDLMFTAVKGGKTDFTQLSNSMFNVIPTASALNVEFGNITAALAAMTAQGTPTSVATTQLRQLLVELSKEGSKAAATFEQIAGKSFKQFIAEGGNLQEALQLMEQHAAGANLGINDLFGSVEAGSAALTLTGKGTAKFAQELENAESAMGATAEASETMASAAEKSVRRMQASFAALQVQIGKNFAPTATKALDSATAQLELMASTEAWNSLRSQLIDAGASWGDINDIVEDGRAKLDLWRTAADMERDLNRNELGIQRMQVALEALNKGLEIGTDEFLAYIRAQEAATFDAKFFTDALIEEQTAIEDTAEATNELNQANLENARIIEDHLIGLLKEERIELMQVAAAEEEAAGAGEALVSVQERLRQIANETATSMRKLRQATAEYFGEALRGNDIVGSVRDQILEQAIAARVSIEALKTLALSTGNYTEEQIDAAAASAELRIEQDKLGESFINGKITAEQLDLALGLLEEGIASSAEEARHMAQTELPGMQGALSGTTTAVLTAKDGVLDLTEASNEFADGSPYEADYETNAEETGNIIDILKGKAEDAAGTYDINYNITVSGDAPPEGGGATGGGAGVLPGPDVPGASTGGLIRGGIANRDSVLMRLMPGEYVLQKQAVTELGVDTLHALNAGVPSGALAMTPSIGVSSGGFGKGGGVNFQSNDKLVFIVNDRSSAALAAAMAHQQRQQSVTGLLGY